MPTPEEIGKFYKTVRHKLEPVTKRKGNLRNHQRKKAAAKRREERRDQARAKILQKAQEKGLTTVLNYAKIPKIPG